MIITKATQGHIDGVKAIADKNKSEVGFIVRGALLDAVKRGELLVALDGGEVVGFCHYHTRKDGWTTVREIAVKDGQRRGGIGTELINAVPRPIRLKCAVDNPANEFYRSLGFVRISKEAGKKRELNVWQQRERPEIIFCRGGSKDTWAAVKGSGMLYGTQAAHTPDPGEVAAGNIFMVDAPFKEFWSLDKNFQPADEPNWKVWTQMLAKVREWKPSLVMVPDYISPAYKRALIKMACQLVEAGVEHVMMCPKFPGAVKDIPDWCVVGVSIPTEFAGYLPDLNELAGRNIHLLGDHTQQQMELWRKLVGIGARVITVDGNKFALKASFGAVYTLGGFVYPKNKLEPVDYYNTVRVSAVNTMAHWDNAPRVAQLALAI